MLRVPDRWLPAPARRDLPEPVPLRRMLGPSVILVGLSIGSGELVLWPRLTAEFGLVLFWACATGVTLQFFLNMEIERWTLATGESAVVGFVRLWRGFGPLFFVCATLPWIWPGWATGAAVLLSWELPVPVIPTAIAGLVVCGAVLSLGPVVYRTVEVVQTVLVAGIFAGLLVLTALLVRGEALAALGRGLLAFGTVPDGIDLPLFLGALAFAGAGGSVNLAQSNYVKDKGYAMGRYIGRITSPFTGREEPQSEIGFAFEPTSENLARWRVWWRRANFEHVTSFWALALLSLALFCLLAATLLPAGAPLGEDFDFLRAEAGVLEERLGPWARHVLVWTGIAVLLSTELALLDAVARVAADLLAIGPLRGRRISLSQLYFMVVWGLIGFGILVLLLGFDSPLFLLVLSASLNGIVMFGYSGLLLWLNARAFRGPLRVHPVRLAALVAAIGFFGWFSVLTVIDRLRALGL